MSRTGFWGTGSTIHTGRRSLSHRPLVDCGRETRVASHCWDGLAVAGKRKGEPYVEGREV